MNNDINLYYEIPISFPYGQLGPAMDWCKKNCTGEWKLMETENGYNFYFENQRDSVIFSLWKV